MHHRTPHRPPKPSAVLPRPFILPVSRDRWPVRNEFYPQVNNAFRRSMMLMVAGDALPHLPFISDLLEREACYLAQPFAWTEARLGSVRAGMIAGAHGSPERTENRGLLFLSSRSSGVLIGADVRWSTGQGGVLEPESLRVEFGDPLATRDARLRAIIATSIIVLIGANALAACPIVATSHVTLAQYEEDAIRRRFGPAAAGQYSITSLHPPEMRANV